MNDQSTLGKCRGRTEDPPHYLHTYQCTRNAKTKRDGMPLCTQHAKMVDRYPFIMAQWRSEARA